MYYKYTVNSKHNKKINIYQNPIAIISKYYIIVFSTKQQQHNINT